MMEYSLTSAPKLQQPSTKSHRKQGMYNKGTTSGVATTGGGSGNGISSGTHTAMSKSSGVCTKCGCKKRHSRTCPFKKGEDDSEIEPTSNASSLFGYLDVVALKRYKKHYRLKTKTNSTKAELAHAVRLHFETTLHVNEVEVIDVFLMKVKTTGSPTL